MQIQKKIENLIKEVLEGLGVTNPEVHLEHPTEISHGDYSSNVSLLYLRDLNNPPAGGPREFAEILVSKIKRPSEVEKIEIAGPGFINFYLSKEFFVEATKEVLKSKKDFGLNRNLKGQKIIIEYTQPNPFKVFHIGHLVNNIVGEAVSRLIEAESPKLKRVTYHGDVGLHVAKAIWAMRKNGLNPGILEDWGSSYAEGDKAYEENPEAKKEITDLNKVIYEASDKEVDRLYKLGRDLSLKHFEEIYTRLGSKFDRNFFESKAGVTGRRIVEDNPNIFQRSQGAIIFPESKSNLHTRVFINSEGLPTYEAKDLGLIELKRKFFKFDRSITVTDIEQAEYYKVIVKAAEFVFPKLIGKIEHLSHGRLRLAEGRMSSRTGNIIGGEDLLNQLHELAIKKMEGREIGNKEEVADQIAVSALKYSILKQAPGKNIIFDFEKSLSFEGDSGPYLQYSAVRSKSILEKAKRERIPKFQRLPLDSKGSLWTINEVEKLLYRFPEVVATAAREYAPHKVATYLLELSGAFNSFYAKEKIVDKDDQNSPYKVALTESFLITLQNGLNLLGIKVPGKM